jgi:hypothetical protein
MGRAGVALLLVATMVISGCSTNWIGEGEQILAVLIPAASNIVALAAALEGQTVSAQDLQTIQNVGAQAAGDLQLIEALITAYGKADAAAQPGILGQIEAAIQSVQTNLGGLLPALHIKDAATEAKIAAVVGIVLAEVQSLGAIVPIVQGQSLGAARVKVPLSAGEFVDSYNATLTAKTGNAVVDRTAAGLRIRLHGGVHRW